MGQRYGDIYGDKLYIYIRYIYICIIYIMLEIYTEISHLYRINVYLLDIQ
jgi:hypothetical protein